MTAKRAKGKTTKQRAARPSKVMETLTRIELSIGTLAVTVSMAIHENRRVRKENASLCNRITVMRDLIERQKQEISELEAARPRPLFLDLDMRLRQAHDTPPPNTQTPEGFDHG